MDKVLMTSNTSKTKSPVFWIEMNVQVRKTNKNATIEMKCFNPGVFNLF